MELFKHFGISIDRDITFISFLLKVRGIVTLYILFNALVIYHIVSAVCSACTFLFPQSSASTKRRAAAAFWDLCIYFIELNGTRIIVRGDDIESDSAVLISNHQSLGDHIVMAYLARYFDSKRQPKGNRIVNECISLPRINFFSWFMLWRVPTMRVLSNLAKCDENWELEETLSHQLFEKVLTSKVNEWVVLFPEVNIWTEESCELQRRQSEKFYLPILNNVLYPRFSGFYNVITTMSTRNNFKFTSLYDVTTFYYRDMMTVAPSPNSDPKPQYLFTAPTLLEMFASEHPILITVDIKSKSLSKIPTKRNKLERWLEHSWVEKDKMLDNIRENLPNDEIVMSPLHTGTISNASAYKSSSHQTEPSAITRISSSYPQL